MFNAFVRSSPKEKLEFAIDYAAGLSLPNALSVLSCLSYDVIAGPHVRAATIVIGRIYEAIDWHSCDVPDKTGRSDLDDVGIEIADYGMTLNRVGCDAIREGTMFDEKDSPFQILACMTVVMFWISATGGRTVCDLSYFSRGLAALATCDLPIWLKDSITTTQLWLDDYSAWCDKINHKTGGF